MSRPSIELEREVVLKKLTQNSKMDYESGCFLWKGAINWKGYGKLKVAGEEYKTHRLSAWIFHNFDLSSSLLVLHKLHCPNKNCWSPSHIYEGTAQQNINDAIEVGTHNSVEGKARLFCKYGHEFTPENTAYYKHGSWYKNKYYSKVERQCKECNRIRERRKREQNGN